ncbi:hypothetical protein DNTS_028524, partial [Danionella cerebrum]
GSMSGAGAGKRPSGGDSPPGPPEKKLKKEEKTTTTLIEPIRIGGVSSTEEMDMKVIQFKNKKLCERLEQRQALEDELREKIEKLEKRQATDDTTLLIVNRCWTQLEENIHELLQHVEPKDSPAPIQTPATPPVPAEAPLPSAGPLIAPEPAAPLPTPVEGDGGIPPPPPSSEVLEEEMQQPALEKEQTVEQVEQLPDSELKMAEETVAQEITAPSPPLPLSESAKAFLAILDNSSEEELTLQLHERMQFSKGAAACIVCIFDRLHTSIEKLCTQVQSAVCEDDAQQEIITTNHTLLEENNRLHNLSSSLQGKHHKMSLEYNELVDKVTSSETKVSEMETSVEDLQWDIEKLRKREQKLNKHLAEALEQFRKCLIQMFKGSSASLESTNLNQTSDKGPITATAESHLGEMSTIAARVPLSVCNLEKSEEEEEEESEQSGNGGPNQLPSTDSR